MKWKELVLDMMQMRRNGQLGAKGDLRQLRLKDNFNLKFKHVPFKITINLKQSVLKLINYLLIIKLKSIRNYNNT